MADERGYKGTTPTWKAIAIGLGVFIIGALAFYVIPGLMSHQLAPDESFRHPAQQEAYKKFDPARMKELKFPNGTLVPQGAPVSLNKNKLAQVAVTEEGVIVYSTPAGGGGGQTARQNRALQANSKVLPQALGPLYAELPDGRFQPLAERKPRK